MNFYNTEPLSIYQLSDIEDSLLEWKIINIPTYIDMLEYHNNELITFCFEINYIIYKLKIIYINDKWIVEFNQDINYSDKIYLIILEMIDVINSINKHSRLPTLILDRIEYIIDKTEINDNILDESTQDINFKQDSESESESDSESDIELETDINVQNYEY